MEQIEQWCYTICIISITTGVLIHIIPDTKIKKCVNIVYSLLFLTAIISIFDSIDLFDINIKHNENNIKSYDYDFNAYITEAADKKTKKEIEKILNSICKCEYTVDLKWLINENVYQLTDITITVSSDEIQYSNNIKSKIGSLTGIIPEVKTIDAAQ